MKRTLRELAGLLGATAAGLSQAQVQIYGTVDVGVGQLANQNPGPPTSGVTEKRGVFSGGLQTSYIGLRGTEDLGAGVSAKFLIESFLRPSTGQFGRFDASPSSAGDTFWSREAYVGLSSAYGELRLGNNGNPLWITMLQTSAMGSNSSFSPSFRQLFNGGTRGRSVIDTAMVNSISYQTPILGGVQARAVLQLGAGRGTRYNYAADVAWRGGPAAVGVAVQSARHAPLPNIATTADQDIVMVGASYNFGFARAFAQYTVIDNVGDKSKLPHFGVTVPVGSGTLQFSSGQDKNTLDATGASTRRTTTTLGYVHGLSKRTDLYGFLMTEKYPVLGPAENRGDSYMVGIRHRF